MLGAQGNSNKSVFKRIIAAVSRRQSYIHIYIGLLRYHIHAWIIKKKVINAFKKLASLEYFQPNPSGSEFGATGDELAIVSFSFSDLFPRFFFFAILYIS